MSLSPVTDTATLTVPSSFDPARDADALHAALTKKGEEPAITAILGHRTAQMRLSIRKAYVDRFNEDLLTAVYNSKLNSDFLELVMCLLIGPIGLLARELRRKLDKDALDEILCTANNWELREIQAAYEALTATEEFKKDTKNTNLEAAIQSKVKDAGHRDYLLRLLRGSREEHDLDRIRTELENRGSCDALIDHQQADADVRDLYDAGEPKTGKPNEEVFINILSRRNNIHLKKVYDLFLTGHNITLVDFIAKKLKGDVKNALNTSLMAAVDQKLLLVAQLYNCMNGIGTRESTLNRIVCLRCEHDLGLLKVLYEERIGTDLGDMVFSETSGEYRSLLMVLLNSTGKVVKKH